MLFTALAGGLLLALPATRAAYAPIPSENILAPSTARSYWEANQCALPAASTGMSEACPAYPPAQTAAICQYCADPAFILTHSNDCSACFRSPAEALHHRDAVMGQLTGTGPGGLPSSSLPAGSTASVIPVQMVTITLPVYTGKLEPQLGGPGAAALQGHGGSGVVNGTSLMNALAGNPSGSGQGGHGSDRCTSNCSSETSPGEAVIECHCANTQAGLRDCHCAKKG